MVTGMNIVMNSSPLIFLARLGFLEKVVYTFENIYLPQFVVDEIGVKQDEASVAAKAYIDSHRIHVKRPTLISLVKRLNQRLGRGESEAIALALELQPDRILLDDFAARKEAMRLGLQVRGTLAVIRMLQTQGDIHIDNLDEFYQKLLTIRFRIKRHIFDEIFKE